MVDAAVGCRGLPLLVVGGETPALATNRRWVGGNGAGGNLCKADKRKPFGGELPFRFMVIHNKNSIGSVCGRAARHSLNIAKRCGQSHTPYYYSFHYKFQAAYCCASIGSLKMGKRANGKWVFRLPIAMKWTAGIISAPTLHRRVPNKPACLLPWHRRQARAGRGWGLRLGARCAGWWWQTVARQSVLAVGC